MSSGFICDSPRFQQVAAATWKMSELAKKNFLTTTPWDQINVYFIVYTFI